jgi:acyl-CoA reductase-like NAD-dependent aldehyde dehydrogenase
MTVEAARKQPLFLYTMETFKIYSAGEFITTKEELPVVNPFTGAAFAKTYKASKKELEQCITAAQKAFGELKKLSSKEKFDILSFISNSITAEKERLARLLAMESGKPLRYATAEIERAAQTFLVAAEEAKRLPGEIMSLDWTDAGKGKEGIVKYFPVGLVAGITPFNFPMNLGVHKIAPAIAAGCPIIIKPASPTPLSLLELAIIIDKTSLPKGALSVLPMDRETGNMMVTDERIKLLSFTGSPDVGWKMKNEAGKKKVVLELGGNAASIITPSADLDVAVEKNIIGGYAYSGQICIHVQRMYVQESIFENFVSRFCERIKGIQYGDPLDIKTDMSVMIDEANAKRIEEWVQEAETAGACILAGGKREGSYYYPTLITGTRKSMKINCKEVFGPVVVVEPYTDFKEAVNLVNDSNFGLQAGVFTNDIREMNYAFNNLNLGGVILNDAPSFRADHMPYGGNKDSGLGREGVKYAIMDIMEPRILVKPTL